MSVTECEIPSTSILGSSLIEAAYFRDSYRAPLRDPRASVIDIFFAVFAHHPMWIKIILIIRNRIATLCGLAAPTAAEILRPQIKNHYSVGDKIGPWPIFSLSQTELVAGRDNQHLDFRLSVLKEANGEIESIVVSTICTVHNTFGKVYLFLIVPLLQMGCAVADFARDQHAETVSCRS
jgi:Protein of unknown function (DUF2867)